MSPIIGLICILGYFVLLLSISYWVTRNQTLSTTSFFTADRNSPWYLIAFGMIGTSISGVTFLSVPGEVGTKQMAYMQIAFGYLLGYLVIIYVLLPLYYKLKLTSIYTYLESRFGPKTYKTGAYYFLISRLLGTAARISLVLVLLQVMVFDHFQVPFFIVVVISVLLIWFYSKKGGLKTIIWTDAIQTFFLLSAVSITVFQIVRELGWDVIISKSSSYNQIFFYDPLKPNYFLKQILSGMFTTIVMTGLDQDMMQKNLTCKNLKEAQTNMLSYSVVLVFVNYAFLFLGMLLFIYMDVNQIHSTVKSDQIYGMLVQDHFPPYLGIVFLMGLIAATYASSDAALAALTTSYCVDILDIHLYDEKKAISIKNKVHIYITLLLIAIILLFDLYDMVFEGTSVISRVLKIAGYTYGPLLGLFAFGVLTKLKVPDLKSVYIAVASPFLTFGLIYLLFYLFKYEVGFELLIINGLITFLGLLIFSKKEI